MRRIAKMKNDEAVLQLTKEHILPICEWCVADDCFGFITNLVDKKGRKLKVHFEFKLEGENGDDLGL